MEPLPIDSVLDELHEAITAGDLVVLEAPPGAGKTTRVPLHLLGAPWLGDQRIVLLEPRRVAARAAAERMAEMVGERVGDRVGLRTRFDTRTSDRTRIEVVTEGVLTRMLLDDPGLTGVGIVIFDEFHERSIHADLGLALTTETRGVLRPDLRLLLMSATIDTDRLSARLEVGTVVRSDGRAHPVVTEYRPPVPGRGVEDEAEAAAGDAVAADRGDVLVFLPGAAAINRVARRLERALPSDVVVAALHGSLPHGDQDTALRPDPEGRRKVILATSIAETSVTIDGVRIVIDSGLTRRPFLDVDRSFSGLRTVRNSRASADQRRGRAGRQEPGRCIRLWPEADQQHRAAEDPPEITVSDLSGLALDLAAWGVEQADDLTWIDPPPPVALARARATLGDLGALDDELRLTDHGRAMAGLAAPPPLAHLMITAAGLGWGPAACDLAAILADRDLLRGRNRPTDVRLRLEALAGETIQGVDRAVLDRARRTARRWRRQLSVGDDPADADLAGVLVSIAYPDRVAQRRTRGDGGFLLANGAGAKIGPDDPLAREPLLAVAAVEGLADDIRIIAAAPLDDDELLAVHGDRVDERMKGGWDRRARDVVFEEQKRFGALVLERRPVSDPPVDAVISALREGLRREGLKLLPWSDPTIRFRQRLAFLHRVDPDHWPAVDDDELLADIDDWLTPYLSGARRRTDLDRIDLKAALSHRVGGRRTRDIDRLAPSHLTVPSGSRIPIDYSDESRPVLAVRLQELFGLTETPSVADGTVTLVVHLLSPAHRPVQVTTDLASFWADGYPEVRRELRGRYPRHDWPEDPTTAAPTNRARRRGR